MDILLVEDNPADMRLVKEALSESATEAVLHWVPSGEAAMLFLGRHGAFSSAPVPDLILLDLNLPGLHGHEILNLIKSDPKLLMIPVVVLTSSSAPQDVLGAYKAHVNAYVVKPDTYEQFLTLVGHIQSYWQKSVLLPSKVT
jgi:two-component system, chemotaxis family, response regulator Rcp1